MANKEQVALLKQGVEKWNKWREENPNFDIDLSEANLQHANLQGVNLSKADLSKASLWDISFDEANFSEAFLREADFSRTSFEGADLVGANFAYANLPYVNFMNAKLYGAILNYANLKGAVFWKSDLCYASFKGADLCDASLKGAVFRGNGFVGANLSNADLKGFDFSESDLSGVDFSNANLEMVDFTKANLTKAKLINANLVATDFVETNINKAIVSGCSVYGINVWDVKGEFEEQIDLIITKEGEPIITVDNMRVAQFIFLILNNQEIRDVINTLTSKSVLILGRFSVAERKEILDELRNKLREYNLLPIVFDFDRPIDQDFTETIKTLAGLSYFVIADVTNPKSSPLELQATVPDYQIPFVLIIQEGERPFSMMANLQTKYDWVLDTIEYDSKETLIEVLKLAIIDPAVKKHNELQVIKASKPKIKKAKDFL